MDVLVHIVIFFVAAAVVWYFAGLVIGSVGRIAKRFCRSGFFTSFFLLGFLTSISEISIAFNASFEGVPSVSVGNLAGASFVILFLIVPLLALAGRGVRINNVVSQRALLYILGVIALPVLLAVDGTVTVAEGALSLLAYGTVAFLLYRQREDIGACEVDDLRNLGRVRLLFVDILQTVVGAIAIFAAAYFLVGQTAYFSELLHIPASIIGLVLLSIGTNVPELAIAIRAIQAKRTDIALGDYLGSAAMNTFIFGWLGIINGGFPVEPRGFLLAALLTLVGLACFFFFARSKCRISPKEGAILLLLYGAFLVSQVGAAAWFAAS